eukprot:c9446_g1_i2 orf=297-653(+)
MSLDSKILLRVNPTAHQTWLGDEQSRKATLVTLRIDEKAIQGHIESSASESYTVSRKSSMDGDPIETVNCTGGTMAASLQGNLPQKNIKELKSSSEMNSIIGSSRSDSTTGFQLVDYM